MERAFVDLLDRNADHAAEFGDRFDDVQDSQHPSAVTICCSDSRVLQDHVWGNVDPGNVFTCSNIGNRAIQRTDTDTVVSGDVLYPIAHTGTETVVVMGHTGCGAVTATYDDVTEGIEDAPGIEYCIDLLRTQLERGVETLPDGLDRAESINRLVEYNVDRQVEQLVDSDDVPEDVIVVGVVYDFQDVYSKQRGQVHIVNVDGERDVETLKTEYPMVDSRVRRLWEY